MLIGKAALLLVVAFASAVLAEADLYNGEPLSDEHLEQWAPQPWERCTAAAPQSRPPPPVATPTGL